MSHDQVLKSKIKKMVEKEKKKTQKKIDERVSEMKNDDKSHQELYGLLGVKKNERDKIDVYQNKGRFVYNALGRVIEKCAVECIKDKFIDADKVKIDNTVSTTPKKFEIDCLIEDTDEAVEIKWRDATTDGDHLKKEHNRAQAISDKGYTPVRLTFCKPNREQAIKHQKKIEKLYDEIGGKFYEGDDAWDYIKEKTGHDLKGIIKEINEEMK